MTLRDDVLKYANIKDAYSLSQERMKTLQEEAQKVFIATYEKDIQRNTKLKLDLEQATIELHKSTLDEYALTKDKKPYPGIGIRVSLVADYDQQRALHWAVNSHHYKLLQLDDKKMKEWIKMDHEKNIGMVPWEEIEASIVEKWTPTIAADINGLLEGGRKDATEEVPDQGAN